MGGLLVITGKLEPGKNNYYGFDGGFGIELWKNLDKWNAENPGATIIIEDDFCNLSYLKDVKKYFIAQKAIETAADYLYLIYVNEDYLENIEIVDFIFIGYDCGYLRGNGFSLLFSSISNELLLPVINKNIEPFKANLNNYNLFGKLEDVSAYEKARAKSILRNDIDHIETAFSDFSIVGIYLFNC